MASFNNKRERPFLSTENAEPSAKRIETIVNKVTETIVSTAQVAGDYAASFAHVASEKAQEVKDKTLPALGNTIEKVKEGASTALHTAQDVGTNALHKAQDVGTNALHKAQDVGSNALHTVQDVGSTALHKAQDVGTNALQKAQDVSSTALHTVQDVGSNAFHKAQDVGSNAFHKAQDVSSSAIQTAQNLGATALNTAQEGISLVKEKVIDNIMAAPSTIPVPPPPPPKDFFKISDEDESQTSRGMEVTGINVAQAEKLSETFLPKTMDGKGI